MPIIGNPLNSVAFLTDSFNGNGSTTAFTMSVAPATSSSILVVISGVTQSPSVYSVVGTTLTFSTAPPSGTANISVRYLGIPASGVTTTAYRTLTEFTATAGQTTFTPPSYTVGFLNVYQNGVMLGSTDYTATNGTTVVLAVGALVGDLVTTESFYVSSVLNALPVTGGTISGNLVVTGTASITGVTTLTGGLNTPLAVTSGGTGVATSTGSGANVLGTSPTLTTPTISTITSAAATALTLQSAGTTAVTIDTSQNVGIGTTTLTSGVRLFASNATNGAPATSGTTQTSGAFRVRSGNNAICDFGVNGTTTWIQAADQTGLNTNYDIAINPNGGNLLMGTASPVDQGKISISFSAGANQGITLNDTSSTSGGNQLRFKSGGTFVGAITTTTSATTYATSSDYRLKDNVTPMTGALATVAQLKPCNYKWIADGSDGQGFIAHEIQAVVPDCVVGEKDAVDDEGKPKYQGIDTSFLVATLTAAIQELKAIIDTQATRISALEDK